MPNEGNKILEGVSLQISFRQSVQKIPVTSPTASQEVLGNRNWILHGKEKQKFLPEVISHKNMLMRCSLILKQAFSTPKKEGLPHANTNADASLLHGSHAVALF